MHGTRPLALEPSRHQLVGPQARSPAGPLGPGAMQPVPVARRAAQAVVAAAAVAGLATLLYFVSVHSETPSSDGATVVLEARAMANGNLALKGWALSLDSFWTVDAPLYMLAVLVTGVRSLLLEAVPAAIAATAVMTSAWVARLGRRGAPAMVAACTSVSLLALPSHTLSVFLLKGGLHVTTALWCLLAFAALRRGRFGWGWLAAVVLLATGLLGDLLALALGVVPVCLAGLVAMARTRNWRAGAPPLCAGIAGIALAAAVRGLADAAGSFSLVHVQSRVPVGTMLANAKALPAYLAHLLGAGGGFYGTGGVPGALQSLHVAGLAVVVAAVVAALGAAVHGAITASAAGATTARAGVPSAPGWHLDDMLLFGTLGSLVAYVTVAASANPAYSRYLTPAVVFGAALGGRKLGSVANVARPGPGRRVALAFGAALIACYGAGVGLQLAQPTPPQATARLASFLAHHHLRAGLGDYWCSSVVTVQSDGKVVVRPVIANAQGRLVRYARQTAAGWYEAHAFGFVVFNATQSFGAVSQHTAVNTFGSPSRTLAFGPYRVLIWPHPVAVSPVGLAT